MKKTSIHSQIQKFATILTLTPSEAQAFLMQDSQFHTFELPEYINFTPVLKYVEKMIGSRSFEECIKMMPQSVANANLSFLLSKDGKYSARPITLANPYLYYFLVREICKEGNWNRIEACFDRFAVTRFSACALPVIPLKKESFHNSTTVLNWWNGLEQRSLELGLEYQYMFVTDIANCYGSINLRAIDKALSMAGTSVETDDNHDIATNLQKILAAMQQGSTSSIPQGSTTFDFIAEMVLGYTDLLLREMLEELGIQNYEVLRYRDDYRIFSNNREELEIISYALQEVLGSIGLTLSADKTFISDSIATDALKEDKRDYIYNTPISGKNGVDFDSLQKHLYFIYEFGKKYPNGSQVPRLLGEFEYRLLDVMYPESEEDAKSGSKKRVFAPEILNGTAKPQVYLWENIPAMVTIAVQIAVDNIKASTTVLRVISRLLTSVKSQQQKEWLMSMVASRIMSLRNMSYQEIWLQNMTYSADSKNGSHPYKMPLCRMVMGEDIELWNNSWLKKSLIADFPIKEVVNREILKALPPVLKVKTKPGYAEMDAIIAELDAIEEAEVNGHKVIGTIKREK